MNTEVQQQLRHQAIRHRKTGMGDRDTTKIDDVHPNTVGKWCIQYAKHGTKGNKIQKRGRTAGDQRTLTPEQEKRIHKVIVDKEPDQLKLPFALWTRIAVQQLIKQLLSIDMPIRTVGEYLSRWSFTPQKPLRRAYEQNTNMVTKWLDEQYPAIAIKAKKRKG